MDIELLVCQLVSDEDIITDLLDSRRTDAVSEVISSDDDPEPEKVTMTQGLASCETSN